ncbi:hypothetical protein [Larkinella rosea]|uniref:DUF4905 domain-containing protein n=1 Tax=Larkinella rosea TaxID=2025312 RepID=A0A3P1BNJ1_9BACT|nr:hypothetical protein [Larkinella rosea]RRB02642.1 hypothetical protein EHT25_19540 [Larkinella rosea]
MTDTDQNLLPFAFQLQFSDPVWRLVFEQIDTNPGLFVAELRSRESQTLTLVTVELPTGKIRFEQKPLLPFHTSLTGVWNGFALYHRFDNTRLPVPTALGSVDLKTGLPRWEWPNHVLVSANADRVWAQRISATDRSPAPIVAFRLTDGEPVETAENPAVSHNSRLHFPVSYTMSSSWWPVFERFIQKIADHQAVESVDYLEIGDKIIFSYYYRETNDQLRSYLLIIDRLQTIWLHQRTNLGPESAQPQSESNALPLFGNGSFCVWQNQVIFPSTSTCITSFYLNSLP